MIELEQVSKHFGKQRLLKSLSLSFKEGKCIALVGPNGSGKTTLIKCILGMILSYDGQIKVNDQNIKLSSKYREKIGYMPQISQFPDTMSVKDLFDLIKQVRKDCNEYDLDIYQKFEIEQMLQKKLSHLSGGMAQKVSASLAFLFKPEIIILDEPTAGLDSYSSKLLKEKINRCVSSKKLVLITSHILHDLDEVTTDVVYLLNGDVHFYDTLDNLRTKTTHKRLNNIIDELSK